MTQSSGRQGPRCSRGGAKIQAWGLSVQTSKSQEEVTDYAVRASNVDKKQYLKKSARVLYGRPGHSSSPVPPEVTDCGWEGGVFQGSSITNQGRRFLPPPAR